MFWRQMMPGLIWLRISLPIFLLISPPAVADETDAPDAGQTVRWLREYIQIDTTNPPGNEQEATAFLASILEAEGIASQTLTSPEGRASLYARLPATTDPANSDPANSDPRPTLVLMHHIDVVPAGDGWQVEPFSGRPHQDKIWGRGALDVKGLGIAQLAALIGLKRSPGARQRDVVFLAVADEENGGGQGAAWLVEAHPELFDGVEAVLNEGGSNRVLQDRVVWWGIEVTQKRPLWLEVTADGRGGHASGFNPSSATHRLIQGLARVIERPQRLRANPAARIYLGALAELEGGSSVDFMRQLDSGGDLTDVPMAPGLSIYFQDSLQVTAIDNGEGTNVVSPQARAAIDIRLLPDTDSEAFLAEIRELLGDGLEVEVVLESPPAAASPIDQPFFRLLEEVLAVRAPVVPSFLTGTTDSRFFRQRGIPAYGFSPFAINAEDLRGIHARDEAVPVDAFLRGIETMHRILRLYVAD